MRKFLLLVLCLTVAFALPAQQNTPASHFDGNSWWAHVKFLADDSLEGRNTGSEGLKKAEAYAVEPDEHTSRRRPARLGAGTLGS